MIPSDQVTISAVIPLYDKEATIVRALQSVFTQERLPNFLAVVDDGSTDTSAEVCREVLSASPPELQCRFISQQNSGVSIARNVGANAFASSYIAFLDADDEWLPGHLSEIEKLANSHPKAGLLSTRYRRLGADGSPMPVGSPLPEGFFGEVANGLSAYRKGYGILHTSTIAVSREAWNRTGGFPPGERKSQDIHLWLRLLLSERFVHSDRLTGVWHEEATGIGRRTGAVPCHLSYFLGTQEGRKFLERRELVRFLSANMANHVGGHRLLGDDAVVSELLRLSQALPPMVRFKARLLAALPPQVLQVAVREKLRVRQWRAR